MIEHYKHNAKQDLGDMNISLIKFNPDIPEERAQKEMGKKLCGETEKMIDNVADYYILEAEKIIREIPNSYKKKTA